MKTYLIKTNQGSTIFMKSNDENLIIIILILILD